MNYSEIIKNYYYNLFNIKDAKEEVKKNKFQDLLRKLFPSADSEINEYTSGLEKSVKISSGGFIKNGRVDAYYGDLVIEFERNIPKDLEKGIIQIKEYCSALWNEKKEKKNYIAIVTDGINWHVYYPYINHNDLKVEYGDVNLKEKETFYLNDNNDNANEFFAFLNRLFFREQIIEPTLINFKKDFGLESLLYERVYENLKSTFDLVKNDSEIILIYEQWQKYLIYTYGSVDVSDELYLKHTYLCILARFIVWAALVGDKESEYGNIELIKILINGKWFKDYGIMNLVEDDFFHWVTIEEIVNKLEKSWSLVLNQLRTYNLLEIKEDLLKGLYQELIDPENRHDLGEYYTPDWLCEKVCESVFNKTYTKLKGRIPKMLDPTCGSGSFLRAGIHHLISMLNKKFGDKIVAETLLNAIVNNIIGMDIHPLAVYISKANYILVIKELMKYKRKAQINIPVYLADSLFMPHSEEDDVFMGRKEITITFLDKKYKFPVDVISNTTIFDDLIYFASDIARSMANGEEETLEAFTNTIKRKFKINDDFNLTLLSDSLYSLSLHLAKKIKNKEDTIWAFVLRNNFRPLLFHRNFDIIIGNPPWLTYNYIKDIDYQKEVKRLAVDEYKVAPKKQKLMTQMELATIFLVHCSDKFLKNDKSILSFVMPRSVFNGDQHEIFRSESFNAYCDIVEYWDLESVNPVFNVPSCVIYATRKKPIPNKIYKTHFFTGKLPEKDIPLHKAKDLIKSKKGSLFQCNLGTRTALSHKKISLDESLNYYRNLFYQGATIVPRNFYFIIQPGEHELNADEFNTKTDPVQAKEGKPPWKDIFLSGIIETDFIYQTALSKHILPFFVTDLPFIALPIIKDDNEFKLKTADELINQYGYRGYPKWLKETENHWNEQRKSKSDKNTVYEWLNYQNKLIKQNPDNEYCLLYNTSGKNISSAVLNKNDLKRPFFAESTTYWFDTKNEEEAYYLCAIFNSEIVNKTIKPFQAKGLLGERHIHTKVLEIPFPKFDAGNNIHNQIALLGKESHSIIEEAYNNEKIAGGLSKKRATTRSLVKDQINKITKLVGELLDI